MAASCTIFESLVWLDLELNQVSQAIGKHSNHHANIWFFNNIFIEELLKNLKMKKGACIE